VIELFPNDKNLKTIELFADKKPSALREITSLKFQPLKLDYINILCACFRVLDKVLNYAFEYLLYNRYIISIFAQ
jgi:hypothetical protein